MTACRMTSETILSASLGVETRDRYFAILEELYDELGYADYLGALQRYRVEDLCDPRLLGDKLRVTF
jgi:hypothetical protein